MRLPPRSVVLYVLFAVICIALLSQFHTATLYYVNYLAAESEPEYVGGVTDTQLRPYPLKNDNQKPKTVKKKNILFFSNFFSKPMPSDRLSLTDCPLSDQCAIFGSGSLPFEEADAVIFHGSDMKDTHFPKNRAFPDQKFVYMSHEAPINVADQFHFPPDNYFDWTQTFFRDADARMPYGGYFLDPLTAKSLKAAPLALPTDSETILAGKKHKAAIWFVSNCRTVSYRESAFGKLNEYFPVVKAGNCAANQTLRHLCPANTDCKALMSSYYFIIIAENAVCTDYVTEKFFNRYDLPVIPIVLARKNYKGIIPPNSVIAVEDFPNAKAMGEYLHKLADDPKAYVDFFKWRNEGWAIAPWNAAGYKIGYCALCEKLLQPNTTQGPPRKVSTLHDHFDGKCEGSDFVLKWVSDSNKVKKA